MTYCNSLVRMSRRKKLETAKKRDFQLDGEYQVDNETVTLIKGLLYIMVRKKTESVLSGTTIYEFVESPFPFAVACYNDCGSLIKFTCLNGDKSSLVNRINSRFF